MRTHELTAFIEQSIMGSMAAPTVHSVCVLEPTPKCKRDTLCQQTWKPGLTSNFWTEGIWLLSDKATLETRSHDWRILTITVRNKRHALESRKLRSPVLSIMHKNSGWGRVAFHLSGRTLISPRSF